MGDVLGVVFDGGGNSRCALQSWPLRATSFMQGDFEFIWGYGKGTLRGVDSFVKVVKAKTIAAICADRKVDFDLHRISVKFNDGCLK